MNDPALLTKEQLITLVQHQQSTIVAKDALLQSHHHKLREQDIALQTKELAIEKLTQERDQYCLAYNELLQRAFRNRSERYIENPDQMRIDFGDSDEAADAALGLADAVEDLQQTIPAYTRRRPRKKRDDNLPAHLPRYEVVAEVSQQDQTCATHGQRNLLPESMWDKTETLEFERPKLKVRVTKYPKYVCQNQPECGVTSPSRPASLVEGNRYAPSIAAEIITGKYSYHLPLYRLQDYFAGCGWSPSRSTQYNILMQAHTVIEPLLAFFKSKVQSDPVVGTDETRVTLLYPKNIPKFDLSDPKQRRMHEVFTEALKQKKPSIGGRMWVYRGTRVKLNVFDFTVSRHRDGPKLFLADYQGTLVGDCWSGFEAITAASSGRIERAACNAHARRKLENSKAYPDERKQWLRWYQDLYDIEHRGNEMSADERLALRQEQCVPIWKEMEEFLDQAERRTSHVILPQSDLGKALQYIRNHREQLKRYLENGQIPIDNNEAEQLMKQVAVGRKNWLFAGSVVGGERSAGFLTLASSALRSDLDVWLYVKDVLDQLLAGCTRYEALLPWNWAQQHPEAIRQYRVRERRQRADRKKQDRIRRRVMKKRQSLRS